MKFDPPLEAATLVRRYKRFLADVTLPDGREVTLHCPNTGSMKNCAEPGDTVYYSTSDNPKRKYAHTWELTETRRGHRIGINTHRANALVAEAVAEARIPELAGFDEISTEVKYGNEGSRIDLLLEGPGQCFVEVKSVTLLEAPLSRGRGYFPDAVSSRGQKHLRELMAVAAEGHRAVLFFCVQHTGVRSVAAARHIDPAYADLLDQAVAAGVEVLAYRARLSAGGACLDRALPVVEPEL